MIRLKCWPLPPEYRTVSQKFGEHPEWYVEHKLAGHEGWDLPCPVETPTFATHDGWIDPRWRGEYGNSVRVYGEGFFTFHAHLIRTIGAYGQTVQAGQEIGKTGDTGRSTGPHLHWSIMVDGVPNPPFKGWLDPQDYLGRLIVTTKTSACVQRIEPWMQQALVDLGTPWVKLVNPPPGPDPMPRIPNKVVRIHTDAIDELYVPRGEAGGRDFVRHMIPQWLDRRWATCYSLACGPNSDEVGDLRNLRGYSMGAMWEAGIWGVKLAILDLFESHPTGGDPYDPEVRRAKLRELLPAVQLAGELGHYVALQAYWRPGIEGPLGQFHALGDLLVKVHMWEEMGLDLGRLQLLGSEWGLDGALEGNPYEGWRAFVARGDITEQQYIEDLVRAEAMAQQHPWLLALFKFVYGWEKPWQTYNHDEAVVRRLVAAMSNLPVEAEPVAPVVPVPSDVAWGKEALGSWPATMKDARLHEEEWIMQDPGCPSRYISRQPTNDTYYVVTLDPTTWKRVRAMALGQTSDLL